MRNTKRFNLSEFKKVKEEIDIPGNFTSVRGAYFIPGINKLGFYKENGCMIGAMEDADLRELLASDILEVIEVPHADIIPIYSEEDKRNGCFSVSILGDYESFVDTPIEIYGNSIDTVSDFVEEDAKRTSKLPNITPEMIEERRKYAINYLYISALLSNTDVKTDNMQIIYNNQTGEYRNPEYYDAGISFISDEQRTFFSEKGSEEILKELYRDYAVEIFPLAQCVEQKLTGQRINEIMQNSIYKGFDENTKADIVGQLNSRLDLIKRYNHNILEYGTAEPPVISIEEIYEKTSGVKVSLKDRVGDFIANLRNRISSKERS